MDVFHQSKIQNHNASFLCDQHVRRLDIAMQLPHLVQPIDSFGKLSQRIAQARFIELERRSAQ